MADVGDGIAVDRGNWSFSGATAKNFDKHVERSIPLYIEGHDLIVNISDFFVSNNSIIYEIGCSTGTLINKLFKHNNAKSNVRSIGIDVEKDMIEVAKLKTANSADAKQTDNSLDFQFADILEYDLEQCDLIVCYYTMQFISPSVRQLAFDKIYNSLKWGGAFIIYEKVRSSDARFQDITTLLYNDYKIQQGYTSDDIISKSQSLKGIMQPFSSAGNIDLMKRAGFTDITTIQKYICFEGFLAIK